MENKEIVKHVAGLARIEVSKEERESLEEQLFKIISYIDKLKELDVEGTRPLRGPHLKKNIFRDDEGASSSQKALPLSTREDILKNAPEREGDYFKIPPVIE